MIAVMVKRPSSAGYKLAVICGQILLIKESFIMGRYGCECIAGLAFKKAKLFSASA